jgi:SAM-dependent methyltransferase
MIRRAATLFHALGSKQPDLRVLEIDAGTGGATAGTLEHLHTMHAKPLFSEYLYMDISPSFFGQARESFTGPEMQFKVFDVEKALKEQGIAEGEYDLVVAYNVLRATRDLTNTL